MPPFIVNRGTLNEPRDSDGTNAPCIKTVDTMTIMPMSANVLALASCRVRVVSPTLPSSGLSR